MGSKNKNNKKPSGDRVYGSGNKPITDERFSLSQKDPRFQDVPKQKNKVSIDSRFDRMFTDKHFSTSSARVDKRGKAKSDGVSVLKNYYRNDDVDVEKKKKLLQESDEELESESEPDDDVDVKDDYSSTDTDEGYVEEEETNALQVNFNLNLICVIIVLYCNIIFGIDRRWQEENVPEIDKETNRLAIVNLDWSQVQVSQIQLKESFTNIPINCYYHLQMFLFAKR